MRHESARNIQTRLCHLIGTACRTNVPDGLPGLSVLVHAESRRQKFLRRIQKRIQFHITFLWIMPPYSLVDIIGHKARNTQVLMLLAIHASVLI
jgi:hypothetical protein